MFSHGKKCLIIDNFLPNRREQVARFGQKIFCGTYSKNGEIFMSACQGNKNCQSLRSLIISGRRESHKTETFGYVWIFLTSVTSAFWFL